MITGERTPSTPTAPNALARALDLEVGKLERLRLRAWQALAIAIVIAALSLTLASGKSGLGAAAVGAAAFVWFSLMQVALARGQLSTVLQLVTFIVEQTVPWGIFVAVLSTSGPEEAQRAWGAPLAYTGMLILTTLKLSPRYSIITGVLGAAQYMALSYFFVRPALPAGTIVETIPVGGDVVRAVMLAIGGFVVAVVATGLRTAVGGIVQSLREQDLFGKYRLEREVASGGMGIVWRATYCPEGGFERAAAVKLVHPHLARDVVFVDAFRREAALCARLVHQNIVQVFDFGRVEERYFLAMEFVDGLTLRDVTKRAAAAQRAIPPVVAGAIARQILAGLHFAHHEAHDSDGSQLRVIHRDLAPSNILLSTGGEVKITDFGIAKALRDATSAQTRTVAGHFDHMAPEQANAGELDERTDLFCVGILLWEMLTGRALFRRDTEPATLFAVSRADVPAPSSIRPELAPFDPICLKALAREPARRFQTAKEMATAIRDSGGVAAGDAISAFLNSLPRLPATSANAITDSQPATRAISEHNSASGTDTAHERPRNEPNDSDVVTATKRDPPRITPDTSDASENSDVGRDTTRLDKPPV